MASLTQQPQLQPQPNIEPPGFSILRDILMRKLIGEEAAPYGFTGSPQQAQGLFTGQGRGMFNPYQGGYGQQPGQGSGGPTPGSMQLPGGGVYGQEPQNSMQTIMGLLQGGGQGGGGGIPAPPPQAQMMPKQGGGGMYGFDGYTLNNQISHEGDFDGCKMGMDAMPGAPPMPGAGSQPGGMMRPMARHPHQAANPQHAAALKAVLMAMLAKRGQRGGMPMRRPMGPGGPPMMGGAPPQMAPRPMGMDSPYHDQRGPMAPLGMDAAPSYPPGSDPNSSVSILGGYGNQGGWHPFNSTMGASPYSGDPSATIAQIIQSGGGGAGGISAGGGGFGGNGMIRPKPREVGNRQQSMGWSV